MGCRGCHLKIFYQHLKELWKPFKIKDLKIKILKLEWIDIIFSGRCNDHYIMVRALNKLYNLHVDWLNLYSHVPNQFTNGLRFNKVFWFCFLWWLIIWPEIKFSIFAALVYGSLRCSSCSLTLMVSRVHHKSSLSVSLSSLSFVTKWNYQIWIGSYSYLWLPFIPLLVSALLLFPSSYFDLPVHVVRFR